MIEINNDFCKLIECQDYNKYLEYENHIYQIFIDEYVNSSNTFLGKRLGVRKDPKLNNRYNGFVHYICGHDMKYPDFNRCSRIKWGKRIIDLIAADIDNTKKYNMKIYLKDKKYHILLEKERFLIVIEDKRDYMMLITAVYLDHNHSLRKKQKDYKDYKVDLKKEKTAM